MLTELTFAPPTLADAAAIRRAAFGAQAQGSDLSFANIYLLQQKYHTEVACEGGVLYRHFSQNLRLRGYAFPTLARSAGAELPDPAAAEAALRRVEEDAAARGREVCFCMLTAAEVQLLRLLRPGRFQYRSCEGNSDYLYRQSDLAELPGSVYHAKRNHIAKFFRMYPNSCYRELTDERCADALHVAEGWLQSAVSSSATQHELKAIRHALRYREALGLFGALLYVEDEPVAMAIGSMISASVADIHYEKCLPAFRGAYPVINREMARRLTNCSLINREEDMNQPGLRQAKMSYHPALLLRKWDAVPGS